MREVRSDYVVAIDAGTGSCRAVVFDRTGRQVAIGSQEWIHRPDAAFPGSQDFDTRSNWTIISGCVREALASGSIEPESIKAVSASSMREGMVVYDEDGTELWACPNADSRAIEEASQLVRSGLADEIFERGGDWVSITAPSRFLWLKRHRPDVFGRISHVGMLSDWILYRLSGRFVTDPSVGSSSGMFDLRTRSWSNETARVCGVDYGIFPEVLDPGEVVGGVKSDAASSTGLRAGTPVVVGGGDTQLGLLGLARTDEVTVIGGSFWQTTVLMDRPLADPQKRLRTLCHVVPGQWMMEGIGFYNGVTMRWFRDGFCQSEKEVARKRGRDAYEIMEELASSVPPGANGVVGVFSNLMDSKRWIHASPSLMQFDIGNPSSSGKKEVIRAIEESAAYVALGHANMIESILDRQVDSIVFTGGAAKGNLWPQVMADVLGVRVKVPMVKESTALGCSICAGRGVGWYDDLADSARSVTAIERTVEPSRDNHERYLSLYENWLKIYERALQMTEDGLLRPLWRAAGT